MLELRTGEPDWYDNLVGVAVGLMVFALIHNRIEPGYSSLLLLIAVIIIFMDRWIRQKRSKYAWLRVSHDFSLAVCDNEGQEYPAEIAGVCWVTSRLIIIPIRTGVERRMHLVVSPAGNDPDTFRRFSVICRFGFAVTDSERHNVPELNPQGNTK